MKFHLEVSPQMNKLYYLSENQSKGTVYGNSASCEKNNSDENMVGCFFTHALHSYIGLCGNNKHIFALVKALPKTQ